MAEYERHEPEKALLHQVVREQLEGFLARTALREHPTPRFIEQELRAFLRSLFAELRRRARRKWGVAAEQCGAVTFIQRFGSALNLNVHFHTLALDGVYPYERGLGHPPHFLPLPPPGADEVARVLAGAARRIQRVIEARAADDADALERNEPLLALLTAASLRTRIATGPHRGEPWRRLGDRVDPRDPDQADADPEASARVPRYGGMSLHADVAVPARDRRRLERLCRYVARPPLASERLEEREDGTLALRLKTRWRDGTTHVLMERSELIERLVPLIPPPRAHQIRYHGVLGPSASLRDRIVPGQAEPPTSGEPTEDGREEGQASKRRPEADPLAPQPSDERREPSGRPGEPGTPEKPGRERRVESCAANAHERAGRTRWAALLQRVFEIDALRCPRCGGAMRLIAAIEDPDVARRFLECLKLPARAPPLGAAAANPEQPPWPEEDRFFDQSPACDEP